MLTYKFDAQTKEFLYSEDALLDPLETEQQGEEIFFICSPPKRGSSPITYVWIIVAGY
jgi:hypothetical protein